MNRELTKEDISILEKPTMFVKGYPNEMIHMASKMFMAITEGRFYACKDRYGERQVYSREEVMEYLLDNNERVIVVDDKNNLLSGSAELISKYGTKSNDND